MKGGAADPKPSSGNQKKKQHSSPETTDDDETMDTCGGEESEGGSDANEGGSDDDGEISSAETEGGSDANEGGSDDDGEISSAETESGFLAPQWRWDGSTQLGDHLAKPVSPEMREHEKWSRCEIKDRKATSNGTWAKAGGEAGKSAGTHAISAIKLEDLVLAGLTENKAHLEIVEDEVYFNVGTKGFKESYNMVSKVNPGDIGIIMGETRVKMDGVHYTVVSVEDGLYSLAKDGGAASKELGQWEVLENRIHDGQGHATLEEDQRKFAISLILQYGNMWLTMVPYLNHGQAAIPEGEGRVQVSNMTYKMTDVSGEGLAARHEDVMTTRSLTKAALKKLKMVDAIDGLRFPGLAQEGDDDLRTFAEREGSLGELNGLQELLGDKSGLDKKILLNIRSRYPPGMKPTGDFKAVINHMLRVQQYAYRLGRPASIHEGYHPLCDKEVTALSKFFRGWEEDDDDSGQCLGTSSTSENMSWATRFAVRRSSMIYPDLFPASLEIESRDTEKYGSVVASSKHVNVYTKTRKAKHVIKWILQNGGVCDNMDKKIDTAVAIFELTKSTVTDARAKKKDYDDTTTGSQGDSNTLKKGKLPLLLLDPLKSEECLRLMTEALTKNGWGYLRGQIDLIDPKAWGKNGWCWEIVVDGFKDATDKSNPPATGHAHFGGRNGKEKKRIDRMVEKLKDAGVELRDFEAAWGATSVLSAYNGACLRDQFHRFLKKRTAHIRSENKVTGRRGLGDGRNVDRVTMWPPGKGKTGKCKERVFDPLCSEWLTVLLVIGWAFYDKEGVVLEDEMGIPNSNGKMKLKGSFDVVMKKVGSTFLGVENLTLHNLRTVVSSLAVKYFYGKGYNLNDAPLLQLAESMDTGVKVC